MFTTDFDATLSRFNEKDSGRFGKAFEINCKKLINGKRGNSDRVAAKGRTDMKNHGITYEIKSNCGELTAIERNKYVIYTYDNTSDWNHPERAHVIPSKDFVTILENCGLIREKVTTNKSIVRAIQSYKNSKRKTARFTAYIDMYPTVEAWFGA